MRYLSACSGIEAASAAWRPRGWECVGVAETAPFPSAVLAERLPGIKNFGDIRHFQKWPLAAGDFDILIGGTPCQSFSLAGKRGGMIDERGSLTKVFLDMARRYRPRWVIWENVPGILSSSRGRDFGQVLRQLEECGYGVCWRVLDAASVATSRFPHAILQRRRRVWLVAHEKGDWRRASFLLSDTGRLPWHHEKGGGPPHPGPSGRSGSLPRAYCSVGKGRWSRGIGALRSSYAGPHEQVITDERGLLRRFTPEEWESLQGFERGWTRVPWRGRPAEDCPDTPRYQAIGNSMPVNVCDFLAQKIQEMEVHL